MNQGDGPPRPAFGGTAPAYDATTARPVTAPLSGAPASPAPTGPAPAGPAPPGPAPAGPAPAGPAPAAGAIAPAAEPVDVRPVRRAGHLGALSVGQIVIAEIAVLLAGAEAARGPLPGLIAGVAAAAIIVILFARRRHRWWLEDRLIAWRHRRRRRAAADTGVPATLAALQAVAPGLSVRDVPAPDGARVGVARDAMGWYSVVALTSTAPVHREAAPIPLDALVGVLAATDQPGVLLQLAIHTVPAPRLDVHPSSPAGMSYRQLVRTLSPVPVPAHRESSVSVRVDAHRLAEALLNHNADPEAAAALVASLGRKVATSLRRLGIPCRVLNTDELVAMLARSCDVEPGVTAGGAEVREEWTRWHSARLVHRTFWLKTWPSSAAAISALLNSAATIPAAQTSVALILDPSGEDDVAVRALIRLAAPPDNDFAALEGTLREGVKRIGGELQPLDGEQGPAVYATAPTGGGAG